MRRTTSISSVAGFVASLQGDRRATVEQVLRTIRTHLPDGYEEVVTKGMVVYQVPFARYADTYNGHPLWYVALASEKSYLSLHLMPVYGDKRLAMRLEQGFAAAGKTLRMGKACVHFANADDLALDVIGEIVAAVPVDRWVQVAQAARRPARP